MTSVLLRVFFVVLCDAKEDEPWRGNKVTLQSVTQETFGDLN